MLVCSPFFLNRAHYIVYALDLTTPVSAPGEGKLFRQREVEDG